MLNYSLDFKDSQVRSKDTEDGLRVIVIEGSASQLVAQALCARRGLYPAIDALLQLSSSAAAKTPGAVEQPASTRKIRGDPA